MAATPQLHRFTVTGRGTFPFDMLRYDRSWPATEPDSGVVGDTGLRSIRLQGLRAPTAARWASFGWEVTV